MKKRPTTFQPTGKKKKKQIDFNSCGETDEFTENQIEKNEFHQLISEQNRKKKKAGGFQAMGLSSCLFKGILRKGYKVPTPIQRKCIPLIMDGHDVVAMARTGSGKTAAFLIPMFEKLKYRSTSGARALLLSPTRELAMQTLQFLKDLGKYLNLKTALVLGGERMENQFAAIHGSPDIIVATPGRLLHVMVEMNLKLTSIEYVVFDEGDRLFEQGFADQLREILSKLPISRQTLLFSATLPKQLVEFAKAGLNQPQLVRLDADMKLSENLSLAYMLCRPEDKVAILLFLLKHIIKVGEPTVIFTATKHHVEFLSHILQSSEINCTMVYSDLDPVARKINVAKFRNGKVSVLLVTDIAARGIDIPILTNVINWNFPSRAKLFVHRVGRVARAGKSGTAYSLVSQDEMAHLLDLQLFLAKPLNVAKGLDGEDVFGNYFGSVPQSIIETEEDGVEQLLASSVELQALKKVAENGYKQYIKSRPSASAESEKRVKMLRDTLQPACHPIFHPFINSSTRNVEKLLLDLKQFKPTSTIFEIHKTSKTETFNVMKDKRKYDQEKITWYKQKLSEHKDKKETVIGDKSEERKETFFVPYCPSDVQVEKGLSVSGPSAKTHPDFNSTTLDIQTDDVNAMKNNDHRMVWDRKKKKFVNRSSVFKNEKKIKTESGAYIPSTYNTNQYKRWMKDNNITAAADVPIPDTGTSAVLNSKTRRWKIRKLNTCEGTERSEMKPKEQILKERTRKKRLKAFQKARANRKRVKHTK